MKPDNCLTNKNRQHVIRQGLSAENKPTSVTGITKQIYIPKLEKEDKNLF